MGWTIDVLLGWIVGSIAGGLAAGMITGEGSKFQTFGVLGGTIVGVVIMRRRRARRAHTSAPAAGSLAPGPTAPATLARLRRSPIGGHLAPDELLIAGDVGCGTSDIRFMAAISRETLFVSDGSQVHVMPFDHIVQIINHVGDIRVQGIGFDTVFGRSYSASRSFADELVDAQRAAAGAGYAPVYAGYHYCIWGVNTTSVGIIDTIDGSRHIIWSSTWGIDVGALRASAELLEHGIIRPVFDAYGEPFPSTTEQNPVGAWTPALPATPPPHRRPGEKRLGPHLPPPRAK